ncbi:MAG: hypothetical protein Q9203_006991, partial [Teloschistes exilis]
MSEEPKNTDNIALTEIPIEKPSTSAADFQPESHSRKNSTASNKLAKKAPKEEEQPKKKGVSRFFSIFNCCGASKDANSLELDQAIPSKKAKTLQPNRGRQSTPMTKPDVTAESSKTESKEAIEDSIAGPPYSEHKPATKPKISEPKPVDQPEQPLPPIPPVEEKEDVTMNEVVDEKVDAPVEEPKISDDSEEVAQEEVRDVEMPDAPSPPESSPPESTPLPPSPQESTPLPPPPPLNPPTDRRISNGVEPPKWLLPPIDARFTGKKCLVLDLDETLVHSSFKILHQADFTIPVEIEGQYHNVYVIKRPGVDQFMKRVGELYEVVVFTASVSKYGDPLLDQLDIHNVVHHRLFRESCYNHQGNYVKDLSQVGRDLRETIIIDNSPTSYIFHPQHAVPISSWFSDAHDNELLDLIPVLEDLAGPQVRDILPIRLTSESLLMLSFLEMKELHLVSYHGVLVLWLEKEVPLSMVFVDFYRKTFKELKCNTSAPYVLGILRTIIMKVTLVVLFIAKIIGSGEPKTNAEIIIFNSAISARDKVQPQFGNPLHVQSVNMTSIGADRLVDGIHPNDNAYKSMASQWHDAIEEVIKKGWVKNPGGPDPKPLDGAGQGCYKKRAVLEARAHKDGHWCAGPVLWKSSGRLSHGVGKNGDHKFNQKWTNRGYAFGSIGEGLGSGKDGHNLIFADLRGTPNGGKEFLSAKCTPNRQRFADLRGTGRADLICIVGDDEIDVYWNEYSPGGFKWDGPHRIHNGGPGANRDSIQFMDFHGNGRDDIVIKGPKGELHGILNFGKPTDGGNIYWHDVGQIASGTDTSNIVFGDINNDGRDDIIIFNTWNDGGCYGFFKRNGFTDYVLVGPKYGGFRLFANNGNADASVIGDGTWLAYFNGDGLDDKVFITEDGHIQLWINGQENDEAEFKWNWFGASKEVTMPNVVDTVWQTLMGILLFQGLPQYLSLFLLGVVRQDREAHQIPDHLVVREPRQGQVLRGLVHLEAPILLPQEAHLEAQIPDQTILNPGIFTLTPEFWQSQNPGVFCIHPCILILPPLTLPQPTKISFPLLTTPLEVAHQTSKVVTVDGKTSTSTGYDRVTQTTTLTIPPVTTNEIESWNVNITDGSNSALKSTESILPPPFFITNDQSPGVTDPPTTRTITPPPFPYDSETPTFSNFPSVLSFTAKGGNDNGPKGGPPCKSQCGNKCGYQGGLLGLLTKAIFCTKPCLLNCLKLPHPDFIDPNDPDPPHIDLPPGFPPPGPPRPPGGGPPGGGSGDNPPDDNNSQSTQSTDSCTARTVIDFYVACSTISSGSTSCATTKTSVLQGCSVTATTQTTATGSFCPLITLDPNDDQGEDGTSIDASTTQQDAGLGSPDLTSVPPKPTNDNPGLMSPDLTSVPPPPPPMPTGPKPVCGGPGGLHLNDLISTGESWASYTLSHMDATCHQGCY